MIKCTPILCRYQIYKRCTLLIDNWHYQWDYIESKIYFISESWGVFLVSICKGTRFIILMQFSPHDLCLSRPLKCCMNLSLWKSSPQIVNGVWAVMVCGYKKIILHQQFQGTVTDAKTWFFVSCQKALMHTRIVSASHHRSQGNQSAARRKVAIRKGRRARHFTVKLLSKTFSPRQKVCSSALCVCWRKTFGERSKKRPFILGEMQL